MDSVSSEQPRDPIQLSPVQEALHLADINDVSGSLESFLDALNAIVQLPHIKHAKVFRSVIAKLEEYKHLAEHFADIVEALLDAIDDVDIEDAEAVGAIDFLLALDSRA